MHLDPVPLTYISLSIDFVNLYIRLVFSAPVVAASVQPSIVIVLDPFRAHLDLVPLIDVYFTFLVILPNAGAISTSAAFLLTINIKNAFFHEM